MTAAKNERMDQMSAWQVEKMLRRAYFDVSWSHVHPRTVLAVAELEEGLKSADDSVRRKAAAFVENLLVRIAHDDTTVDRAYGHELRVLVRIYKERAPDQIAKMNQAFPQSKTLAYLHAF